jgi:hypothetical protein
VGVVVVIVRVVVVVVVVVIVVVVVVTGSPEMTRNKFKVTNFKSKDFLDVMEDEKFLRA